MVTLQVVGNYRTSEVRLSEAELATIRQAKYYCEESARLMDSVLLNSQKFRDNNPNWNLGCTAIHDYVYTHAHPDQKVNILYD